MPFLGLATSGDIAHLSFPKDRISNPAEDGACIGIGDGVNPILQLCFPVKASELDPLPASTESMLFIGDRDPESTCMKLNLPNDATLHLCTRHSMFELPFLLAEASIVAAATSADIGADPAIQATRTLLPPVPPPANPLSDMFAYVNTVSARTS
jgi:hypothetical protein